MVQTIEQQNTSLLTKVTALHTLFQKAGDKEVREKSAQLALKLHEGEFSIAFCGHFSAGKSSMINKLTGGNLLPSSPIPTSANLVKVKAGDDYAKVYFHHDKPSLYPAPYDYDEVKSYCKDGDQIKSIEISYSHSNLPKGTVILDTPGIDSTDDAHRIATESALHLADLVFYVMDYNHVQSELNFLFTKELTSAGKDLYLIINQIDKHREEELSFESFQAGVKNSFASWGVEPEKIFYTSLKDENHPLNQFSELQQFIQEKINIRGELLPKSVYYSLKKLTEEHLQYLSEQNEKLLHKQEQVLANLSKTERDNVRKQLPALKKELKELQSMLENRVDHFDKETNEILKNAYLMPYQTRELAENYLQACQSDFKVGLFFSKQKTAAEREKRLNVFYDDLAEKVKSQLEWHLKEHVLNTLKKYELHRAELGALAQSFSLTFHKEFLEKIVKTGARLSGDYVLNYTNDVANELKRLAKAELSHIRTELISALKHKYEQQEQLLNREIQRLNKLFDALAQIDEIEAELVAIKIKMEKFLRGEFNEADDQASVNELLDEIKQEEVNVQTGHKKKQSMKNKVNEQKETEISEPKATIETNEAQVKQVLNQLQLTAKEIQDVPGFKKIAAQLEEKANRLKSKGFTVALFGAFSAGKSSFANALIGEKLLPVSPNPTTATINKIMPVDEEHPNGTALVKLKDHDALYEDVSRSLKAFDLAANDLDSCFVKIEKVLNNANDYDSSVKTHYAFLHAFYSGFRSYRHLLGEVLKVDLQQFQEFVAKEEKSCLVEWIEVYYDCELTRKGITLVDTPGADSINARHTGVAFDYIKNSDACFFVTYYNHAFSKADREFLIQLGRVKDTFELDKMFFIINAIDLANNEEEMESVIDYVNNQLMTYGIRKPSLFPVSSLLALEEKIAGKSTDLSRMKQFEQAFYSFLSNDLMNIAISSAQAEIDRTVELLDNMIASSYEDQEVKEEKRRLIKEEKVFINKLLDEQNSLFLQNRLTQETDELAYYIKQRVFFRFGDFFKESFNPSILKDDGRNLKKAVQTALEDFLSFIGFDFAQEMRATTLRLEAFIHQLMREYQQTLTKQIAEINHNLSFSQYEASSLESIDFESAFIKTDRVIFKKALSYFKTPKGFFEKNEKQLMSDELERQLQEPAEMYLQLESKRMKDHYLNLLNKEFETFLQNINEQVSEFYEGILTVLGEGFPVERLLEIKETVLTSRQ
ncbi:dynamin family protein [Bacillus aquiflavi]|uniref:Dynamin family protein n=1 Tax=Bacillus aquiflavi TaxID=2672567 RepID=A0A6B3VW58_9BACI|nr:dynamin family protein [Bacillus aquiflavi]MBA4536143.1 dynamin family protein [Bacillus aquiflavi]NEY80517.1 Dynamin family protein [Bacillus aquiflavi]